MNVGLIAPIPSDGTSFYRSVGPFAYLARERGIRLQTAEAWDWTNLLQLDAMVLQRPFSNDHGMVAKWCKALNLPLWVDYDDLYTGFPNWTPVQQRIYGSAEARQVMEFCLDAADVVTVSSEYLRRLSPKAVVLPNALNTYLWPLSGRGRRKVITWRGSGGHLGDMDPHVETIRRISEEFSDWEFHWLGEPHFKLYGVGTVHPFTDLFSYMETFQELAPSVHIVPLADTEFNRCKSNIAWLEASAAGALTIAPDFQEWRRPGVVRYRDKLIGMGLDEDGLGAPYGGFEEALRACLAMSHVQRIGQVCQSRKFILDKLRLSVVNEQRWQVLCELVKGKRAAV